MGKKYYAIKMGLVPGIYNDWDEAEAQIHGFPGAQYKGFNTKEEAEAYLNGTLIEMPKKKPVKKPVKKVEKKTSEPEERYELPYAFVDGSFNPQTNVYGCGGFIFDENNERYPILAKGEDEEMASMRNVAGEVLGATLAIQKALELGLSKLTVYYDYEGIEMWATRKWKRNKKGTAQYSDFVASIEDKIKLTFVHVTAHTGIPGNEEADKMAKEAVGIR